MRGFYTTHEAARLLGVSLPTVVNWIKARRLKAHRTPGGHRRISREDLAGFMIRHGMPLPEELAGAAPTRRKALVVGEVGPMREGLARQLAEGGYAVEQASPGFAAGAAAARFQPDLFVVAATSTDDAGTVSALRADRDLSAVPVVAVALSEWTERLTAAGCSAVLTRPLPDRALLEAAGEAMTAVNAGSTRRGSRSRG